MGWNGSGSGNADGGAARRPAKRSSNGAARGLVAGLVVVAGAAACWLLLTGREEPQPERPDKGERGLIGEVTPAAAPTNRIESNHVRKEPPQRVGQVRDGKVLMPNGELRAIKGEVTNSSARAKARYAIFKYSSENILAGLLTAQPGMAAVGTPRYNGIFEKNFLASLNEPIIIGEDDSIETKDLKQAIIDAKTELKAAYDRGEDIEQIVLDSRAELQRLARVREEMKRDLVKTAAETIQKPEDLDDFFTAANMMLEKKGIAPLDRTPLMGIKLRLLQSQEAIQTITAREVEP